MLVQRNVLENKLQNDLINNKEVRKNIIYLIKILFNKI